MAAFHGASSSSLSSSIYQCAYDVFLSFRGQDTRRAFTAHLYAALRRNDINTFMDDKLRSEEEISPGLLKAIEESAISIIVLSKNYASSPWCLDELMKILECRKTRGQQVLPLFYHVQPSEVRNQSNSVGKAFAKLEERFKHDQMKLQRWKTALLQVANLSGRLLGNKNEAEFIREIIQWVNSILVKHRYFQVAQNPESLQQYVKPLLDIEKNIDRTCVVGIFEISGIDTTTIAKTFYNLIASLTEENKRSERRSRAVLCALDSKKLVKAVDHCFLFIKKIGKHVKDLIGLGVFRQENMEGIYAPFFDWECIRAATDNFSNAKKIGQGGFGCVFKGIFPGGEEIAVKRLSKVSQQGIKQFEKELVVMTKLQHMNIVGFRGYCIKGKERITVYEYMPNRSLDSFIFDQKQRMRLDWKMRVNIILGIVRGLLYLHRDSKWRIVHRDLKPGNILLDEQMNPKICDFGLARIVGSKENRVVKTFDYMFSETDEIITTIAGTIGYMSPESLAHGIFSIKSDVYSFGVLLLEIISGRRSVEFTMSEPHENIIEYAWILWGENKVFDLMDPTLHEVCNADQFVKCVHIGLLCVQDDPNDRPTTSNVVTMLESETGTLPTPKQPAYVSGLYSKVSSFRIKVTYTELTNSFEFEGR
ncbi:G-type lectin S-receptor-like serine/threonine-protein kinase At4g03230 [Alnus glutinosa]|uniref:G-type lectin S-receptor-like serine/threonine-protein kinase At4g03230 n=1 Tax=Alnus glutinosa TaxID=3517 RepID=UPI002D78EFBA|nr:G-type lectin S-receptor-like serine/threonine-protein kinase At4g03230 [Alnus glutinosa]